jgi:hypothetical protein
VGKKRKKKKLELDCARGNSRHATSVSDLKAEFRKPLLVIVCLPSLACDEKPIEKLH